MGQISVLFVHKVVAAATVGAEGEAAARTRDLFALVGVDPESPVDPQRMVRADAYYELCARAARTSPHGPALPLIVGASMACDDYGAFGLAWKSAVDLRRSFQRAERYGRVLTSVAAYELVQEDGRAFMTLRRSGERRLGLRISNEQTLAAITQISREVSGGVFSPRAVFFKHPGPQDLSAHELYFGCPVYYGADRDALEVTEAALARPNLLGDPGLSGFFSAYLDRDVARLREDRRLADEVLADEVLQDNGLQDTGLEGQKGDRDLAGRVRQEISRTLSEGAPGVAEIAERLGMSGRTLQRRLGAQNQAFQEVLEEARRNLAERLLRESAFALAEVAFLTGFSDQSAFSRAFKRWSGRSPAQFRREATGP